MAAATAVAFLLTLVPAPPAAASPFVFEPIVEDGFPQREPPSVTATSWIVFDESSDTTLAEWDADTSRPMASITKIMTVMLALESGDPDDEVIISSNAAATGGQEIGLVAGEVVTLGALARAALIRSGNDAATAIAEHLAGSVEGFVGVMNQRAAELGMENTNFANPHGLDASGHYSTPRDMLAVARQAMTIKEFADIARARAMVFPDTPSGEQRTASNTNRILNSYPGVVGIKTGETPRAGLTYVGAVERDGRVIYVVVFGSVGRRAHFADAIKLWDWAFGSLRVHGTITAGIPYRPIASRVEDGIEVLSSTASGDALDASRTTRPPGADDSLTVAVNRTPRQAPDSLLGAVGYWFSLMLGDS